METIKFHQLPHSPAYHYLIQAGPRLQPLKQAHAYIITSGFSHSRSLLTKLLTLVCAAGSISYTRKIFQSVSNPDSFLFNSLIKSTSKYHKFSVYSLYFYKYMVLYNIWPSAYTFTSLVKSCADLSSLKLGKTVHGHVLISGFGLDVYVQAALVAFYAKCGDLGNARKVFDKMCDRSIVAWNSMISGYEQNGCGNEAIGLFNKMREEGFKPDSATFVSVLSACAQLGAFSVGCWVHNYIAEYGLDLNVVLGTSLINMYTRCGYVRKAREVFDAMNETNVVSWTAMISGYGTNGYGLEAVDLFDEMRRRGPRPNRVTFVAVLSACAHAGLVKEGRLVFARMREEYHFKPGIEHHVCYVDLLGRAGLLDEAFKFINEEVPKEPAAAIWTAMLGACKMHKNFDLGVQVAEHLLAVEPENPGHYVMLSNIYALAGRMDRVEKVRNIMIGKSLKKQVGYSTIEVNQKTYLFSMGDKSHPETAEIYRFLDELMSRCREAGYASAHDVVMHELEEEEREFAVRYHSEKLAIAFGILKTSHDTPIRIVKNLRMCEDCHRAIKYISVVANREIIVRDRLRFHHFKNGSCSCVDYW
ncbi:pentatricopeptide repeat-containing protein At2g33760-like [Mercurialis annua]|uniref:pentatricopeptide repeat-containing protein At2g33760-like n=1 Tax=Mercurialis annua TaxID=3986 RepID=UPI00215E1267|nr:pentatricopeptide repeat-containing protein At2g33760-like [Mercurialis annua]